MENQTLTKWAADQLIAMIREGNYAPRDKLPTEAELSENLNVGRNTIREALRLLVSRNIITIRQGSGIFLSEKQGVADDPFGFCLVSDRQKLTRDLLQVRVMLEPPIAALAAQNRTGGEVTELESILRQLEELMKNREAYEKMDIEFHVKIAQSSHNSVMSHLVPVISRSIAVFAREVQETEYEQTFISHRAIFEAIKNQKPVESQQAMYFHLLYNENRYAVQSG
ncbi:MAG: FadR family transcriptional regulator [Hungatella sp.]|nr:FadR family transcriptional regulator [Hungatella sp.]